MDFDNQEYSATAVTHTRKVENLVKEGICKYKFNYLLVISRSQEFKIAVGRL